MRNVIHMMAFPSFMIRLLSLCSLLLCAGSPASTHAGVSSHDPLIVPRDIYGSDDPALSRCRNILCIKILTMSMQNLKLKKIERRFSPASNEERYR